MNQEIHMKSRFFINNEIKYLFTLQFYDFLDEEEN